MKEVLMYVSFYLLFVYRPMKMEPSLLSYRGKVRDGKGLDVLFWVDGIIETTELYAIKKN